MKKIESIKSASKKVVRNIMNNELLLWSYTLKC